MDSSPTPKLRYRPPSLVFVASCLPDVSTGKIEFPMPNEEARARIMQIHSRKMNVSPDVNYEELARCTDDFNGAQCKAVCVEAGMIALRRGATELTHEDYMEGILEVQAKKKANLQYYALDPPFLHYFHWVKSAERNYICKNQAKAQNTDTTEQAVHETSEI
ncbi:unnamed protein product [Ranitomeya imitator]|uniref:AAA ATPase AAA+ lid domain-containing protein n=1 Tax=Ranitomeya imitator TaxID=111125 RepID=A0ABN9KN72_9NEOB|nr:unnamed protein product [Ranitomeya imitator]